MLQKRDNSGRDMVVLNSCDLGNICSCLRDIKYEMWASVHFLVGFRLRSGCDLEALCRDSRRTDLLFITAAVWTVLLLLPWWSKTVLLLIFWHQKIGTFSVMEKDDLAAVWFELWFAAEIYILRAITSFVCHFPPLRVLFLALSVSADQQECVEPLHIPSCYCLSCLCSIYINTLTLNTHLFCFLLKPLCNIFPSLLFVLYLPPQPPPPQRSLCSLRR